MVSHQGAQHLHRRLQRTGRSRRVVVGACGPHHHPRADPPGAAPTTTVLLTTLANPTTPRGFSCLFGGQRAALQGISPVTDRHYELPIGSAGVLVGETVDRYPVYMPFDDIDVSINLGDARLFTQFVVRSAAAGAVVTLGPQFREFAGFINGRIGRWPSCPGRLRRPTSARTRASAGSFCGTTSSALRAPSASDPVDQPARKAATRWHWNNDRQFAGRGAAAVSSGGSMTQPGDQVRVEPGPTRESGRPLHGDHRRFRHTYGTVRYSLCSPPRRRSLRVPTHCRASGRWQRRGRAVGRRAEGGGGDLREGRRAHALRAGPRSAATGSTDPVPVNPLLPPIVPPITQPPLMAAMNGGDTGGYLDPKTAAQLIHSGDRSDADIRRRCPRLLRADCARAPMLSHSLG